MIHQDLPGNIRLYCADSLKVLPTLEDSSVDAIVTDPPYSSGGLHAGDRRMDPSVKYEHSGVIKSQPTFSGDQKDQRSFSYWCHGWLSECHRVLRSEGYILMFCDWRQLPVCTDILQAADFIWRGVVAWDKGEGSRAPGPGRFRHQCEYIVWGTKGAVPKRERGVYPGAIKCPVNPNEKWHMTGKPIALMNQLLQIVEPGGTICDPFAGSGSTAMACREVGLKFIGMEKDASCYNNALKRLGAPSQMFLELPPEPEPKPVLEGAVGRLSEELPMLPINFDDIEKEKATDFVQEHLDAVGTIDPRENDGPKFVDH